MVGRGDTKQEGWLFEGAAAASLAATLSGWVMGRADSSDVGPAEGAHRVLPAKFFISRMRRCQGARFRPCSSRCWEDYQKDLSLFN